VIVAVRPVSTLRFGTCAAASSPQRSLPTVRLPTLLMSTCFFLLHQLTYIQSAQPSPYILWKSRIPRRLPANLPPRHCTRLRGSAPRTDASGVVWNVGNCTNSVRTRVIESLGHTPLVIDKVRFTRLFYVNFGAYAPYHNSKVINQLTVPTAGMSACKSSYRKKLVGR
jgi:hypothetical protein